MGYRNGSVPSTMSVLRGLADRVRKLENKKSVTVGNWNIGMDRKTGNLVAVHRPTKTVRVIGELDDPQPVTVSTVRMIGE